MNEDMQMDDVQQAAQGNSGVGAQKVTVEEVVQLLMQGVQPQELVDAGVPVALIEQAITVIQEQMKAQQPQGTGQAMGQDGGQGLAKSLTGR